MYKQSIVEIMSRKVTRVKTTDSVIDVVNIMAIKRRSCVIVCDAEAPLGIITERDIVRLLAFYPDDYQTQVVADVMTSPPVAVHEDMQIVDALELARARRLRHLVVISGDGSLAGVVTQTDMVASYLEEIHHLQFDIESVVKSRTENLEQRNRKLLDLAMEDSLMRIGNRRAMEIDLQYTQSAAERYGDSFYVALIDVDFFKKFNDRYGHQTGDDALRRIAKIIRKELRDSDRIYRYGGEEILLLMPKVSLDQAVQITDRAREAVETAAIEHLDSATTTLTVSAGVAFGGTDWHKAVKLADAALYRAKDVGRNTVCS